MKKKEKGKPVRGVSVDLTKNKFGFKISGKNSVAIYLPLSIAPTPSIRAAPFFVNCPAKHDSTIFFNFSKLKILEI